ncbi:hypothetical protein [Beijerinckia sp. L45]|uniref:hypothetical protein n=1 Tax=Beijerinckia sp. L45 TaxID=1641855 RepID=UPI00131CFB3D|nr:hypothetical protein [Beijerinckia sp. L45]
MTVRAPLVLGPDGLPQQLQSGDSISAPVNTPSIRAVANNETAVALAFGQPVYANAADGVKRAQANSKTTSKLAGLVYDATIAAGANGNIAQSGVLVGTTAQWDAAVTGQTGGLTFGSLYFLDPGNVGKLTTTPPTTVGTCNVAIGTALSATELELQIAQPILL